MEELSTPEITAIIVGLRLLQKELENHGVDAYPPEYGDSMDDDFDESDLMTCTEDIDDLIEEINTGTLRIGK